MLLALVLCAFASGAVAQTYQAVGARTTKLEAGKQYFISAATFYSNARPNLLFSKDGKLTYSDVKPSGEKISDAYLFTVEEVGDDNTYVVKDSQGKYLKSDDLTLGDVKTAITIIPYADATQYACGSDVQACDEQGNKIEYEDITVETPVVCVYADDKTGWRHISGLEIGKATPFAFYEVTEESLMPELTTDVKNPILYTIKNIRGNAYASYNGGNAMKLSGAVTGNEGLFYFTKGTTEGTYKIHNYFNGLLCVYYNSWNAEGTDWYIKMSACESHPGLAISNKNELTSTGSEAWNDFQNTHTTVNMYGGNDAGSTWKISRYEGETFDLKLSTAEDKHFYSIKNVRSNKFANYVAAGTRFTQVDAVGYGSYWYFVDATADLPAETEVPAGAIACRVYNAANELAVENPNGNMAENSGVDWPAKIYYLMPFVKDNSWGYVIYPYNEINAGWNDLNGSGVTNYDYDDSGSIWYVASIDKTETQLINEAVTAKSNALNTIATYEYADYYTYSDEVISAAKEAVGTVNVDGLVPAVNSLMANAVANAMSVFAEAEKGNVAPVAGQYIQLKNKQYGKFLRDNGAKLNGGNNASDLASIWLVEAGTGDNVKLKNVSTGKYIGEIRQSADVAMVDAENAKEFEFTNQTDVYAVFKETTGADYAYGHVAGHNVLVGWEANSNATQWAIAQVPFPVAGKYYQIKSANPDFFAKQGVEMAMYSNASDGRLSWKALDATDKSFYWTITPNAEGKYVFQNAGDSKYVPVLADDRYTMTEDNASAAAFTLSWLTLNQFNITGNGTMHMREHGEGAGKGADICSWGGGINSSSAWTIVEVENPDLAIAKAALAAKVAELEAYVANTTGAIGYYKAVATDELEAAIAEAEAVLNGGSSDAAVYEAAMATLTAASEGLDMNIVLPETGKFYRIKNNAGNAYLNAGTTDRAQFAAGVNELASSVFYYDGKLLSYANGMYLANAGGFLNYGETVGEGAEIAFEASKEFGKLQIKFGDNRYFYSNGEGQSNAGGNAGMTTDGNYRFTIEEVTWLPVAMNATVGYATLYSPVQLALSYDRVKAYTATREGNVLTLVEQTVVPANTGVILELQEGKEGDVQNGYVFLQVQDATVEVEGNALVGSFAKSAKNPAAKVYTLQMPSKEDKESVGFYLFKGQNAEGTTYINGFRAWVELPVESGVKSLRIRKAGDETSIENTLTIDTENAVIYDLAGRRVQKMEKGIYIVNGRKVVVK